MAMLLTLEDIDTENDLSMQEVEECVDVLAKALGDHVGSIRSLALNVALHFLQNKRMTKDAQLSLVKALLQEVRDDRENSSTAIARKLGDVVKSDSYTNAVKE